MKDWRETVKEVLDLQASDDMKTEPGPSVQWYPQQWLGDAAVTAMDWRAQGIHHHLLMIAWKGFDLEEKPVPCSLPDDQELLRDMLRLEDGDPAWRRVLRGWKVYKGRLWSVGLCRSYLHQMANRKSAKEAAEARWRAEALKKQRESGRNADAMQRESGRNADASESHADASESHADASKGAKTAKNKKKLPKRPNKGRNDADASKSHADASKTDADPMRTVCTPTSASASTSEGEGERAPSISPDDSEELRIVFEVYLEYKFRWYQILKLKVPMKSKLTAAAKTAIRNALKAGHSIEDICTAIRHVENDAWLMGMTDRAKAPQLTLTTILLIRTNGGKPLDRVQQLIDKTTPDQQMGAAIGLFDNRSNFVREEDLPPLDLGPDEGPVF